MKRELSLPQPLTRRDFLKTSTTAASAVAIGALDLQFPEGTLGPGTSVPATLNPPAEALGLDFSNVTLPQQYPTWSDGMGWNEPQQYRTIQLADIDGDGRAELIGRGSKGIEVYHWNEETHLWDAVSQAGPFADADGWTAPDRYSTIQLADLDGDGKAELIGRGSKGIEVWSWNVATHKWDALGQGGPFADWTAPEYYSTIQCADIDGDGKEELIGRGSNGLQTYHWNKATHVWSAHGQTGRGPLTDAEGWAAGPQYYSTIQLGDIDGDNKAELIARSGGGLMTFRWDGKWTQVSFLPGDFADSGGWWGQQYYSSLQLADINGDGKAELIARSWDGLLVAAWHDKDWHFGPASDTRTVFADAAGWSAAASYLTIQCADINGDGKAEIIGRTPAGLVAYRFDDMPIPWSDYVPFTLTQVATAAGVMADVEGWGDPQCYLTIQAANVDGGPKGHSSFSIVGRATDGVQTWKWSASIGVAAPASKLGFRTAVTNGFYQPTEPGFPNYSNIPGQLRAYQLISQYLLQPNATWPPARTPPPEPGYQDIRAQYINQLITNWSGMAIQLKGLAGRPPPGVSIDDFNTVRLQLQTEFRYVGFAYTWFGNARAVLQELFDEEEMSVTIVSGRLDMPLSELDVVLNWLSIVALIVGAITVLLATTAANPGVAPAVIAACAVLISSALRIAALAAGGSNSIKVQVLHLQEKLLTNRTYALATNDQLLNVYLQHWGLLKALGEPIQTLAVTWPVGLTDRIVTQGRRGYELTLWQTLSPTKWYVTGYYDRGGEKYAYQYQSSTCTDANWLFVQYWSGVRYYDVPDDTLDHLFGKPDTGPDGDPAGPLGVPITDVMLGRNGWSLPQSLEGACNIPPPPSPSLVWRRRVNPIPRPLRMAPVPHR
jgi:hypothetical protein